MCKLNMPGNTATTIFVTSKAGHEEARRLLERADAWPQTRDGIRWGPVLVGGCALGLESAALYVETGNAELARALFSICLLHVSASERETMCRVPQTTLPFRMLVCCICHRVLIAERHRNPSLRSSRPLSADLHEALRQPHPATSRI